MTKLQPLPLGTAAILEKNGTVPFSNGRVFKEKWVYVIQRVYQRKQNPVGSRYLPTITSKKWAVLPRFYPGVK